MSPPTNKAAYVTLLTKPSYLAATLVLHSTLISVGSKYPLVVMVTPGLAEDSRRVLRKRGIILRDVESLRPEDGVHNLAELDQRLTDTWTKLRTFELTEYDRVVMLDSDMIVLRNMDELMDLELPPGWIAAAHVCACNPLKIPHYPKDWIPENCAHSSVVHPTGLTTPPIITESSPRPYTLLNSGNVVLNPSQDLFNSISHYLSTSPLVPTFSFTDQDLLSNVFIGKWKPLPWCYNALKTLKEAHKPLWRDEEVRCLHYILAQKPWHIPRGAAGQYEDVHSWWWDKYDELVVEMKNSDPEGFELMDRYVTYKL